MFSLPFSFNKKNIPWFIFILVIFYVIWDSHRDMLKLEKMQNSATGIIVSNEESSDSTGASIQFILVSDTADSAGFVERGKSNLPDNPVKIYVSIQAVSAEKGRILEISLLNNNDIVATNKIEIKKTGTGLIPFVFTAENYWPKGEYQAKAKLSSGASKTVKFTID